MKDPIIPHEKDCELFQELVREFDFSELPTIRTYKQGWWRVVYDMYREVPDRNILLGNWLEREEGLAAERAYGVIYFLILIAASLLVSLLFAALILLIGIAVGATVDYWAVAGYTFATLSTLSFLIGAWRGYLDLYPRAWFRYWWSDRKQERSPIQSSEVASYLIEELSREDFGDLIQMSKFYEHLQALIDYRAVLKRSIPRLEKAKKSAKEGQRYSDIYTNLTERVKQITAQLEKVEEKQQLARSTANTLINDSLPSYQEEAENVLAFLEDMQTVQSPEEDILIAEAREQLANSRDQVIDELHTLQTALHSARQLVDEKLEEYKQLRDDTLQPLGDIEKTE